MHAEPESTNGKAKVGAVAHTCRMVVAHAVRRYIVALFAEHTTMANLAALGRRIALRHPHASFDDAQRLAKRRAGILARPF